MPQYAVYRNKSIKSKEQYPYIIDIQNNLLDDYHSRVIMPIAPQSQKNAQIKVLSPIITIHGIHHVIITKSITTVSKNKLKPNDLVCIIPSIHTKIISAVDMILSGI
ncbi:MULTISPECIES: CcdB family protein [Providencia]|uniref:CcdB family protein n=1 Tax=Providencia TaxID=586 RepID=UPI001C5B9B67|nr:MULTISPECIES: CcdB family protein [Providencia]QXX82533.1 CcdB family protein [Providencia sp. R33]